MKVLSSRMGARSGERLCELRYTSFLIEFIFYNENFKQQSQMKYLSVSIYSHFYFSSFYPEGYSRFFSPSSFYSPSSLPQFPSLFKFLITNTSATFPSMSSQSLSFSGMQTNSLSTGFYFMDGGGPGGGGGLIFLFSSLMNLSLRRYFPFSPHLLSLTSIGSPNSKSRVQTWHKFFSLLHDWQMCVLLQIPLFPFHLKTVNGLKQIRHSWPQSSLSMRIYGFSPQHLSQATGKSDFSHPCLLMPVLMAILLSLPFMTLINVLNEYSKIRYQF